MRILSLSLEQFRNYASLSLDFTSGDTHIFLGENGAGKTNILEALSILSMCKSCLGSDEEDLLQWGSDYYRVSGSIENGAGEQMTLEVVSQKLPRASKACFLNDVKRSVDDIVGVLPTVIFLPKQLELFSGPPAARRSFLDRLLCQVSPEYLRTFSQYQKVLKQRNALLKKVAEGSMDRGQIALWDEHVVTHAVPLTLARLELIGTLQLTLGEEMMTLGEDAWTDIELRYTRKGQECEEAAMKIELREILSRNVNRDIILQSTSAGPHREDWHIAVDTRDIATFASRGQQRTALLALLLLQVSYLELRCGEKPVILLDDVFSELDDHHQSSLLQSLKGYQVLMTTTHVPESKVDSTIWHVVDGAVRCAERKAAHV